MAEDKTILMAIRKPTRLENESQRGGGDIAFDRWAPDGRIDTIFAVAYEDGTYHQWGARTSVLGDNVDAVTAWARGAIPELKEEPVIYEITIRGSYQGVRFPRHQRRHLSLEAAREEAEALVRKMRERDITPAAHPVEITNDKTGESETVAAF